MSWNLTKSHEIFFPSFCVNPEYPHSTLQKNEYEAKKPNDKLFGGGLGAATILDW